MSRFASVTSEHINEIRLDKDAKTTKKVTEILFHVLIDYCKEKNINLQIETISKSDLDTILSKSYVEVRKNDGTMYKKSSFYSMRFAIQRKLKAIRGDKFDVIEDREFSECHSIFAIQCVVLKKLTTRTG